MSTIPVSQLPALAALGSMLAAAVFTDVSCQRIPNRLAAGGAVTGLLVSLLPGGIGIAASAGGLAAGLAMFMPLYLLRGMGGGDVKLMAAVGAFTGWPGIFEAAIFALIAGGVLSLAWAFATRSLGAVLANMRTGIYLSFARVAESRMPRASDVPLSRQRMPYALAIAAGTLAHVVATGLGS